MRKFAMLAKLTAKNQLTLPKSITREVGDTKYFDVKVEGGQIILTPVKIQRADAVRAKLAALDLSEQDERFTPLASKATVKELIRVLAYPKFKLSKSEQEDLLADYLPFCETVLMPEPLPTIPNCRDPFDAPFLLLALVGESDYLVTGDRDLLSLAAQFTYPIVTADQFCAVNNLV
jgi:putative PIN family toxin of toxin-antitoxin system